MCWINYLTGWYVDVETSIGSIWALLLLFSFSGRAILRSYARRRVAAAVGGGTELIGVIELCEIFQLCPTQRLRIKKIHETKSKQKIKTETKQNSTILEIPFHPHHTFNRIHVSNMLLTYLIKADRYCSLFLFAEVRRHFFFLFLP